MVILAVFVVKRFLPENILLSCVYLSFPEVGGVVLLILLIWPMQPTFGEEGSFFLVHGGASEIFTASLVDNLPKNGNKLIGVIQVVFL